MKEKEPWLSVEQYASLQIAISLIKKSEYKNKKPLIKYLESIIIRGAK